MATSRRSRYISEEEMQNKTTLRVVAAGSRWNSILRIATILQTITSMISICLLIQLSNFHIQLTQASNFMTGQPPDNSMMNNQQPMMTTTTMNPTHPHHSHSQQQQQHLHQHQHEPMVFRHNELERDTDYWMLEGRKAIEETVRQKRIEHRAKNAIIFIGDGMSLPTITAARILYGQLLNKSGEEEQLSFEKLPNVSLIKTYNLDQQIPDSAATATAILTGVKSNFYTLGVNGNVKLNDTNCQKILSNQVESLIANAIKAGKSTGIITNTRITHATPAAAYAHVSNRRWECDAHVPKQLEPPCKDIARQLIEDEPGNRINVIMGGGRRCFFGPKFKDPSQQGQPGLRHDNRNLIDDWIFRRRLEEQPNFAFVNSTRDLRKVDIDKTDYLLGLFSYSHMQYEELRDQSMDGEPSLDEMTQTAIKILRKNPKGYVLLVEGGRIDHAHHENVAGVALRETIALSWAIQEALKLVDVQDTLLAVTADHAHTLTINGLAPRGNPILGLSRFRENSTQIPYTTLIYGNGPGHHSPRRDPTVGPNSTESPYYVQYAAIHQEEAFHDGSDVGLFATGPYAHLFQGVQEQSYIAHVFNYALCMGQFSNYKHCNQPIDYSSGDISNNEYNLGQQQQFGRGKPFRQTSSSAAHSKFAPGWEVRNLSIILQLAIVLSIFLPAIMITIRIFGDNC